MKGFKKVVSVSMASLMVLGGTVSFAAQGDFYKADGTEYKKGNEVLSEKLEINKVLGSVNDYAIEMGNNKIYTVATIGKAIADHGKDGYLDKLDEYEAIKDLNQNLQVESVSAINLTTIKVVFSEKIDSILAGNFAIEGATVENANLAEDSKTVTLKVSGLDYDKEYTLKSSDVLVNAQKKDVADVKFTSPSVNDLWELELTTSAKDNKDKILANGSDNAVITAKLLNKETGEVDTQANDIVLSFSTTYGNLANTRVTVQNGVATVMLTSEFSSKDLISKIDVQIIDASGDYKDLIGNVSATKNVYFVTSDSTLDPEEKPALISAGSNHADRVTLYFNKPVSIDDFVKKNKEGKYQVDADGNAILISEVYGNETIYTEVNITQQDGATRTYKVRGFKQVKDNPEALEAILDVGRTDTVAYDAEKVLIDNKRIDVELIMPSNVGAQTTRANFILTDARKPEATSVVVEDLRTLKVKFSESIARAGVAVDGGLVELSKVEDNNGSGKAPIEFGEFKYNSKTNAWDDNRDIVTVNIGVDEDGKDIYLAAGKHSLQLSSVFDFAGLTDGKNISTSQSLDFTVAADDQVPTATVKVESPEQFRVTFNRKVNGFNDLTNVELQKFVKGTGGVEDKWLKVNDPDLSDYYDTVPQLAFTAVADSSDYVLELKSDWTQIYDTKNTKLNYYNDQYRLVIAKEAVTNPSNGKKNAEIILPLNYAGSPLNSPDTTNPAIVGFEKTESDNNQFNVLMNKPVKLPGANVDAGGITDSQQQNGAIPNPSVEFIGKDKNGNSVTIEGTINGYGDKDAADKIIQVTPSAVLEELVTAGHSSNWQLIVRSISDDVGNTAGTLTHDFKIQVDSVANKFEVATVNGIIGTTVDGKTVDKIEVTFTSPVKFVGNVENAVNVSNYQLDSEFLPKGSSIKVNKDSGNVTDGYTTVDIILPTGTLNTTSNALTVSKNLKSSTDIGLTGAYIVEFESVTQESIDAAAEVEVGVITTQAGFDALSALQDKNIDELTIDVTNLNATNTLDGFTIGTLTINGDVNTKDINIDNSSITTLIVNGVVQQ